MRQFVILKNTGKNLLLLIFFIIKSFAVSAQLDIDANIEKARQNIVNKEYRETINILNLVIKQKADSYNAYFYRAIAKFELSDYNGAINDFSRVIHYNPFLSDAFHYRGVAKNALNDFYSAIRDYDIAVSMDVDNANLLVNRGLAKIRIKQYAAAIDDFNKALIINSKLVDVYLYRAAAKTGLEQYQSAIDDCNYAIRTNPFNAQAFARRALIKYELKNFEEAIKDFDLAIKLQPKNSYTYYLRALAKYNVNDLEGSLKDYNSLLSLSPYNALAYYNRAMINIKLGHTPEAINDLSSVIKIKPMHLLSYYNRAVLHKDLQQFNEALNDLSESIELYPDFGEAYYLRSMVKRKLGMLQSAKTDYLIAVGKMEAENSDTSIARVNAEKYQKVIELEANFDNNLVAGDKIYSVYSGINPLPNYLLNLHIGNTENQSYYEDENHYFKISNSIYLILDNQQDTSINYQQIKKKIDALLIDQPNNYRLWHALGIINGKLHDYNSAMKAFDKALEINPKFAFTLLQRANSQIEMLDFINQFDDRFELKMGGNSGAIEKRMQYNYDYKKIIEDCDKAIALLPNMAICYFNRANVKVRAKLYKSALSDYKKAVRLDADFADAYYNMALLCIFQNEPNEACKYLSKAGELGQEKAYLVIKRYCKK